MDSSEKLIAHVIWATTLLCALFIVVGFGSCAYRHKVAIEHGYKYTTVPGHQTPVWIPGSEER